jgi:hypothetical protein
MLQTKSIISSFLLPVCVIAAITGVGALSGVASGMRVFAYLLLFTAWLPFGCLHIATRRPGAGRLYSIFVLLPQVVTAHIVVPVIFLSHSCNYF